MSLGGHQSKCHRNRSLCLYSCPCTIVMEPKKSGGSNFYLLGYCEISRQHAYGTRMTIDGRSYLCGFPDHVIK